jgi:Ca-activated chloride channel family protein
LPGVPRSVPGYPDVTKTMPPTITGPAEPNDPPLAGTWLTVSNSRTALNDQITFPFASTNRFVTGLEKKDFTILEDGKPQIITNFSDEDAPVSIGFVFDSSGSVGGKLTKAQVAVKEFLKTANPDDEFFLVEVKDVPNLIQPFTKDIDGLLDVLSRTGSQGRTSLIDAIYVALHEMRKAKSTRRAIIVISDGGDNSSRYTENELKRVMREGDIQIHSMGLYEDVKIRSRSPEELAGPGFLAELSESTGGRAYELGKLLEVPDIAVRIGIMLRNQYVLGYSSQNSIRDGKYRRVQVRLRQPPGLPPLRVFWRMGYYAPAD